MFNLDGQKALVTGASGGIGGDTALALAKMGAHVVLSGRRKEALDKNADAIMQAGGKASIVIADLGKSDSVATLIQESEEKLDGGIDILVNNAGITRDNLAMRMKQEEWDDVINVNLSQVFFLTQNCIKGMMKRRHGRVINIGSIVGATGNPGQANYCAAKAGLGGMTRSLALELASRNITVNMIAPGFIKTAMTDALNEEQKSNIMQRIPLQRMGDSTDIAAAVCFLSSQAGGYITGQTMHINGGMALFS
jgi:3-oxoacyl-[acyl-carrier protein] reductase